MTKGVLGNDPFQRGAAPRAGDAKEGPTEAKAPKKAPAKKAAKGAKKTAKSNGKTRDAKEPSRAKGPKEAAASPRTPAVAVHKFEARANPPRGATPPEHDDRAASEQKEPRSAPASRRGPPPAASGSTSQGDEPTPLREPSTPRPPVAPRAARPPVPDEGMHAPHREERGVDRALTEALASDAAEVAAKSAVEELLPRRPGQDRSMERILATELVTELAESAVRQVLDDDHDATIERELATMVATQVAEATAGVAVDEVLDRQATTPDERAVATAEDGDSQELDEAEEEVWTADAWQRDPASVPTDASPDGDDASEGVERGEADGVHISVSIRAGAAPTNVEPEVELPDESHDELPPSRRVPLSLVTDEGAPLREDPEQDASAFARPEEVSPSHGFAGRAAGMFSLAREIAGQALASEGLGRAVGAMHGLMEAVRTGLGTGGGSRLDDYGKDAGLVENLQPVLDFLYEQYWRVSVEGVDHVPRGAAILVANHSGALPYDGLVMSQVLLRERPDLLEPRWLVEDQVFHAPMLGTLFNRLGAVRASPENALRLLDERRPLVVFPEGYQGASKPFAERYRLKRFGRGGFVKLALRTGAPIVPVAIVGAEETSPLLGRIPGGFLGLPSLPLTAPGPLPAKWTIRFGEPITMEGLPTESADDLGEVQRLTEQTREAIQAMLQALLRERRSVFAG
ncbi:1-acyl-sn-glycerol-3-phosphate acyltransferase [Corallococcus sp. BB11-1]|uniref:1-acyl-sn-glycerol-3-phosphate acyltransferase n=1 Tax=Corallococcus sp. BB11-1 TaxID=2996783 RepID=UPI00226D6F4D|nr:1-acyl-sn-glycerol-3-phosphate acyltransferase [Corallococcus sp. BB11-1]MCY1034921.1 1-acyl-sn-glycerol-3-phosphate acyltransferase [Corallococcus sp. BB11-1]